MQKRIIYLWCLVFFLGLSFKGLSQSIAIGTIDAGPYGRGSDITVPISIGGSFKKDNKFELFISDASGSFASERKIGEFDSHFATYVNGVIPGDMPAGTDYRLKVRSTNPLQTSVSAGTVTIEAEAGNVIKITTTESNRTLVPDKIFGFCSQIQDNNSLAIKNQSSAGSVVSGTLINDYNPLLPPVNFDFSTGILKELKLKVAYYTARFKAVNNGIVSTKSYVILNSTYNLSLQSSGSQTICLGDTIRYSVNTGNDNGSILTNYPGLIYRFEWGDNSTNDYLTQYDLVSGGGYAEHAYLKTSCGKAPIDLATPIYNSYQANIFIEAGFCTGATVPITTYPRVFVAPEARFEAPINGGCVNTDILFRNTTIPGQAEGVQGETCTDETFYKWYVKKSTESDEAWSLWSDEKDFIHRFTTPGTYNIKLIASNNSCSPSEKILDICIEERPRPDFEFTQSSICTPVTLVPKNLTPTVNQCNLAYFWQVVDSVTLAPLTSGINYLSADTSLEPKIEISKPGKYLLRLSATNSCDMVVAEKPFTVAGPVTVSLPSDTKYCRLLPDTIDFSDNANHKPTYTGFSGHKTIKWEISGGVYSYVKGDETSEFPVIKFDDPGQYTIKVTYSNECNVPASDVQLINYYGPIVKNAGPDDFICDNVAGGANSSYTLKGNQPGTYETGRWTVIEGPNTPVFANATLYNTAISSLIPGKYTLRWTISNPAGCNEYDDMELTVFARPYAGNISGSPSVCIGGNVSLEVNALTGKIVRWESSTDNVAWTAITDTNTTYVYTNLLQKTFFRVLAASLGADRNCLTQVYSNTFVVNVDPLTVGGTTSKDSTFCGGSPNSGQITLSGHTGNIKRWERSTDGGTTWQLISSTQNPFNYNNLTTTTQFRAVVQSGECLSQASSVTTITILKKPTVSDPGEDEKICLTGTTYTLKGNNPVNGTGAWTQKAGPPVTIDHPNQHNTSVSGLQKGERYKFAWTISNGICNPSEGIVTIDALTDVVNTIKTDRPVSCKGDKVNLSTDALSGGNIAAYFPPNYTYLWEWSSNGSSGWNAVPGGDKENISVYPTATTYYRRKVSSFESCDFISNVISVTINAVTPSSNAGTGITLCNATNYQLNANDPGTGFTGSWKDIAVGSTLTFWPDNHTSNAEVRGLEPGKSYELQWSIAGISPCPDEVSSVKIVVRKAVTTANGGTPQQICLNQTGTNNSTVLDGNMPDISNGEKGKWSQISGPAAIVVNASQYNTTVTGLQPGTYIFEWKLSNDAIVVDPLCNESKAQVKIEVTPFPVAGIISGGITPLCRGNNPGELRLNGHSASALLQWQSSVDNVTFNDIPSAVTETYNPPGLLTTTWYRVKVMQLDGCAGVVFSDTVRLQVDEPSVGGTADAVNKKVCTGFNNGSIALSGYTGSIIRWETSSDGGTVWTPVTSTANPYHFTNLNSDTQFRAVVKNGSCPEAPSTPVTIQVLPNVTVAIAGSDQNLCNAPGFNLDGNAALKGTGVWTKLSGPDAVIANSADPKSQVTGVSPGTYIFTWKIGNDICDPSVDTVVVYNYPQLVNQITGNTIICSGQSVRVEGIPATGGNNHYDYSWEKSSDNITWSQVSGENEENLVATLTASAYFRRVVNSGPCTSESSTIFINVQPPIINNNTSGNQELCLGQPSSQITGTLPTGADGTFFYQWQKSVNHTDWTDISGETGVNILPPVLTETTYYRRVVTTALCNGSQKSISNETEIVVHPLSKAEFSASKQKSCVPFDLSKVITPVPYDDRNATYEWFADGLSIGTGKDFPGYTILNDGEQVKIELRTTSKFGCGSDRMETVFETVKNVTASFTKDQVKGCGPLIVNFTNTSVPLSGGSYLWNFGNGQTSDLEQPGSVIFAPHPLHKDTTYIITLTASTDCQSSVFKDTVLVRPKPQATFSPSVTRGCSPLEVTLVNQSAGTPNTYTFDFGDGGSLVKSDNSEVKHTYYATKTDTLTIRLIAENECGKDTSSYQIVVYPNSVKPELVVDGNRKFGCVPFTVKFDNNSIGANRFYWDFKDGGTQITTSAPESLTHTFTVPGTYNVSLLATNGCSSGSVEQTIMVFPKPNSEFSLARAEYCIKDSVEFINELNAASSFIWDFDDGSTSNMSNPKHVYVHPGKYTVKLTAVQSYPDGSVCSSTTSHEVEILPLPVALFTSNSTSLNCAPFKLIVSSTPANAANVEWNFGDAESGDNIASGYSAEHIFTKPGLYRVKAIAYNLAGCMDSVIKLIKIAERPKAEFSTASDTLICGSGATITFNNQSSYGGTDAVTYRWLINNSFVSASKNFTYTFSTPSGALMPYKYEIKLVARSIMGCPDTVIHTIQFNPLPKAAFTPKVDVSCPPFKVEVDNNSGYADQFFWYLDGRLVSNDRVPANIVLNESGKTYVLKLVTGNIYGCRPDSVEKTIRTYPKPQAVFTLADSISCNGKLDIRITNMSTGATGYIWDFGDNSPSLTGTAPDHLYGQPGIYNLRLIAYNSFCRDTLTKVIRIAGVPQATFTSDVKKGCTQINVTFQNISVNATKYLWDFGDGSYSTSKNPSHTFSYMHSPYSVKLIAIGEYGCADTTVQTNYIEVTAPPQADFAVLPDSVIQIPEYTFSFKNTSAGSPVKYKWSFGDGKFSDEENPVHTYLNTGSHTVKLIVTNIEGCTDTVLKEVRIDGVPGFLYVPSGFEPGSINPQLKTFIPKGTGIAIYSLKIFNKWGQLIWQTDKLDENGAPAEGWDGTVGSRPVPQGVYIWEISAKFIDGNEWKGMKYEKGGRNTVGPIHLIR